MAAMRDYQAQSKWFLPRNVYMQTLYQIRDYPRLKEELQDILDSSPALDDGMPRGSGPGDPTFSKAERIDRLQLQVRPIESALEKLEPFYRKPVLNNIIYGTKFDTYVTSYSTYRRKRQEFIWHVANLSRKI